MEIIAIFVHSDYEGKPSQKRLNTNSLQAMHTVTNLILVHLILVQESKSK